VAIEKTPGDVLAQTTLLCRHMLAQSGGAFTQTSFPSEADAQLAIDAAEAEILSWLAAFRYSTDLSSYSDTAKVFLSGYNALGAAYRLEMAHTGLTHSTTPSNRADSYYLLYMDLYKKLESGVLQLDGLGVPRSSARLSASVTGVSASDKKILEQDADAVQALFKRDGFKFRNQEITET